MLGSFLNHALLNMLIHAADNPFDKEKDVDYKDVVSCRTAELIFCMMLHDLGDVVIPGQLKQVKKVYGIDWKANTNIARHVIKACNGKYANVGALVEVIDSYVALLKCVNKEEDD